MWDEAGRSTLEGEQRPGEERPFVGVNNADVGERIRSMSVCRCKAILH